MQIYSPSILHFDNFNFSFSLSIPDLLSIFLRASSFDMETFPPSPQAGFFAVMVPNRIFVGGFSASVSLIFFKLNDSFIFRRRNTSCVAFSSNTASSERSRLFATTMTNYPRTRARRRGELFLISYHR